MGPCRGQLRHRHVRAGQGTRRFSAESVRDGTQRFFGENLPWGLSSQTPRPERKGRLCDRRRGGRGDGLPPRRFGHRHARSCADGSGTDLPRRGETGSAAATGRVRAQGPDALRNRGVRRIRGHPLPAPRRGAENREKRRGDRSRPDCRRCGPRERERTSLP